MSRPRPQSFAAASDFFGLLRAVEAHARKQDYFVVHRDPTPEERHSHAKILKIEWGSGYPSLKLDMSLPISRAFIRAAEMGAGERVVVAPTLGGSGPLYRFDEVLQDLQRKEKRHAHN